MLTQTDLQLTQSFCIGTNVTLGKGVKVHENASLSDCSIGDYCVIGPYVEIHNGVVIGNNVRLYSFINLYGCTIGDATKIGAFVEIQKGVLIGARCKISSHSFLCEGVTIEDEVFVGHGVKFINDHFPRATRFDGELKTEDDWKVIKTIIRRRASIGSGAIVMCGISIGEESVIGAGSVVTKDIPNGQIWINNPARYLRDIKPEDE